MLLQQHKVLKTYASRKLVDFALNDANREWVPERLKNVIRQIKGTDTDR